MNNKPINHRQLWEVWPSKNRIICKGKCMTGPRSDLIYYIPCLSCLIIVPNAFFLFVAPYIFLNVTYYLPILSIVLYISTLAFYFATTFMDPGIIPRRPILEIINNNSTCQDFMNIDMNRFCSTCQIYKPSRSHHCKKCDNCVEIFDHHCPYLNNCIGGRNYLFFFAFVLSATLLSLVDIAGCFLFIFHDYKKLGAVKPTCK